MINGNATADVMATMIIAMIGIAIVVWVSAESEGVDVGNVSMPAVMLTTMK